MQAVVGLVVAVVAVVLGAVTADLALDGDNTVSLSLLTATACWGVVGAVVGAIVTTLFPAARPDAVLNRLVNVGTTANFSLLAIMQCVVSRGDSGSALVSGVCGFAAGLSVSTGRLRGGQADGVQHRPGRPELGRS